MGIKQASKKITWKLTDLPSPEAAAYTAAPSPFSNITGARNDVELQDTIKSTGNRTVVVDFGAAWCDHCKGVLPAVIKMTEEFTKPLFVLTDVDAVPETSKDVRYTPTFSFFKKGKKVDEIYGVNQTQLRDHIWLHSNED
mmetsp:Transcript_12905/g.24567  ORF Transcript_12905/g.24567 Transcript_12905/m.24567 type:complete len:140 (+) Transcript_12905:93-512(+)|eukprot:CAMPEP_0114238766 /NCGR_PEP_ID=MMETSP0058-20121206/8096_1 /TAXON_ID=36894 /ORGANISM="Pyramimonas parkeae, CCMP726" /LENGTH=139 /DNA_ID=CAMNT_0001350891 /DNA_START=76 /DNA_END=495 /DNA_ORIENTATION=+